jgi:sulfite reductase alpha subunit-like flavoprotein
MPEPLILPAPPSSPPTPASVAVFIVILSAAALLLWRAAGGSKRAAVHEAAKELSQSQPDPGREIFTKKKIAVLYGTQTGTAVGFAKV